MFFSSNRRSGTTTLIKDVAKHHDVWVLVPNSDDCRQFGEAGLPFSNTRKTEMKRSRPLLVDNHSMLQILQRGLGCINDMEDALLYAKRPIVEQKIIRSFNGDIIINMARYGIWMAWIILLGVGGTSIALLS